MDAQRSTFADLLAQEMDDGSSSSVTPCSSFPCDSSDVTLYSRSDPRRLAENIQSTQQQPHLVSSTAANSSTRNKCKSAHYESSTPPPVHGVIRKSSRQRSLLWSSLILLFCFVILHASSPVAAVLFDPGESEQVTEAEAAARPQPSFTTNPILSASLRHAGFLPKTLLQTPSTSAARSSSTDAARSTAFSAQNSKPASDASYGSRESSGTVSNQVARLGADSVDGSVSRTLPQGCHRIAQDDFLQQVCAFQQSSSLVDRSDAISPRRDISVPSFGDSTAGGAKAAGGKHLIICPIDEEVPPLFESRGSGGSGGSQSYAISGTMFLNKDGSGALAQDDQVPKSRAAAGEEDGYWRQVNGEQVWFPSPPVNEAAGAVEPEPLVQHAPETSSPSSPEANAASSPLPVSTGMPSAASPDSAAAPTESNDSNSGQAGASPAGGPESVVDAAKEYDAWKASIGGQDAPAFLSFAEWKERHLAEKEREEQEKKERRKKEKLKEREEKKKNGSGSGQPQPGQTQRAATSDQSTPSQTDQALNLNSTSTWPADGAHSTNTSANFTSGEQSRPISSALDDLHSSGLNVSASQVTGTPSSAPSVEKSTGVSGPPSSPSSSSAATGPASRAMPPRTEDHRQATSAPPSVTAEGGESVSSSLTPSASPSSASVQDDSQDHQSQEQAVSLPSAVPPSSRQAGPNDTNASASAVPEPQLFEMKMVAPGGAVVKGHVQELLADEGGATPAVGNPSTLLATLKHRWNFASLDCAAVIHRANPSAKFASSILSEKKDRYMLSPCPGASDGDPQGQFVIVELCDEIKIDTLVLANFEFFSRMFKRFQVRASKNLMDDVNNWYDLGTFRARNLRGLQVFNVHPPSGDRQFFRYMRIDFQEHYGQEYYCPLSLLRVYGLTQLDDFKKEEEESQRLLAAMDNEDADLDLEDELDQEEEQRAAHGDAAAAVKTGSAFNDPSTPAEVSDSRVSNGDATGSSRSEEQAYMAEKLNAMMERSLHGAPSDRFANESVSEDDMHPSETDLETNSSSPTVAAGKNGSGATSSGPYMSREFSSTSSTVPSSSASLQSEPIGNTSAPSAAAEPTLQPSSFSPSPPAASTSGTPSTLARPAAATTSTASSSGGESIYRAITKRLNALEANATLSLQYMEHNGQMLLDVFAKMEKKQDDRLGEMLRMLNASNWRQIEALKRRQHVDLQRAIFEFDVHRQQAESERMQLLSQVHLLASEVLLERRLSIAQLLLMFGLFGFVALTRGASTPFERLRRRVTASSPPTPERRQERPLPLQIDLRGMNSTASSAVGSPRTLTRASVMRRLRHGIPASGRRSYLRPPGQSALRSIHSGVLMTPQHSSVAQVISITSPQNSPHDSPAGSVRVFRDLSTHARANGVPSSAPPFLDEFRKSPSQGDYQNGSSKPGRIDESVSSEWSERSDSSNPEDSDADNADVPKDSHSFQRHASFGADSDLMTYPTSPTVRGDHDYDDDEEGDRWAKPVPWQQIMAKRQGSLRKRTASMKSTHSSQSTSSAHRMRSRTSTPGAGRPSTPPSRLTTPERNAGVGDIYRSMSPLGRSDTPDTIREQQQLPFIPLLGSPLSTSPSKDSASTTPCKPTY